MEFCRSALGVLIFLIISTESESATPVVTVEVNSKAVLPCTARCSGVASWTPSDKASDILAQCDRTSSRSVKEGYQMIHNQSLQGDLSLIIPEADLSKRGRYTCDCDGRDQCDVELQVEEDSGKRQKEERPKSGSESATPVEKVEVNSKAVLPCTGKCSGVVSWTRSDRSSDIFAECNQTSCRSVKEGYQMIHNQYLQGDLSLTISEADFSKCGRYTCDCDGRDQCDVELQVGGESEAQSQTQDKKESPKSDAGVPVGLVVAVLVVAAVVVVILLMKKNKMPSVMKLLKKADPPHSGDQNNEKLPTENEPLKNHEKV